MKGKKEAPVLPPVETVKKTTVPTEVLVATLEYLANRPFKEVYQLVQAIQTQSEEV